MGAVSSQSELQAAVRLAKQIPSEKFGELQGTLVHFWVAKAQLQQEARLLHSVKWQPCSCAVGYRCIGRVRKSERARRKLEHIPTKKG